MHAHWTGLDILMGGGGGGGTDANHYDSSDDRLFGFIGTL